MTDKENEDQKTAGDGMPPDGVNENLLAAWHERRLRNRGSSFYGDAAFIEWLAAEARYETSDDDSDETVQLAHDIQARVTAARSKVKRIHSSPEFQRPLVAGSPQQVAEAAADAGAAPFLDLSVAAGTGRELWDEECSSWVKLPRGIPKGPYVALKVSGESMLPLLHSGDVMIVRLDSPFSSGDIAVARVDDGGFVVKRVGRVTADFVELVSINPAFGAIRLDRSAQPVIGVVVLCWCDHQPPSR